MLEGNVALGADAGVACPIIVCVESDVAIVNHPNLRVTSRRYCTRYSEIERALVNVVGAEADRSRKLAFRGRIQLRVEARFGEGQLSVVRLDRKNLPERSWILYDPSADKALFFAMLLDEDRGPWPRDYELRLDDQVLNELHVKNPGQGHGLGLEVYPTPFNPRITLRYTLPQDGQVSVIIVDARGRRVRRLSSEVQSAGTHQLTWDGTDDSGSNLASGVYHAQLISGAERATQRLVLVR